MNALKAKLTINCVEAETKEEAKIEAQNKINKWKEALREKYNRDVELNDLLSHLLGRYGDLMTPLDVKLTDLLLHLLGRYGDLMTPLDVKLTDLLLHLLGRYGDLMTPLDRERIHELTEPAN